MNEWKQNEQGNWYLIVNASTNEQIRWHVSKRNDGWWWYVVSFGYGRLNASAEVGPFISWQLAVADCVVSKGEVYVK